MKDFFDYQSPMAWLGRCADTLFLTRYMRRLIERRRLAIKVAAERIQSGDSEK
jgi:hypothetical protein